MSTCNRKDCTEVGGWVPVLVVWAIGDRTRDRRKGAHIELGLLICLKHRDTMVAADFISDGGWQQICEAFAKLGRAAPDRTTVEVGWLARGTVQ